jgi:hypothetical protein
MNTNILRLRVCKLLLKLANLRIRYHQCCMYYKLALLYLLDKRAYLSVLRKLNESSKQLANFGNGFNCGHKCDHAAMPNDQADPQPGQRGQETKGT